MSRNHTALQFVVAASLVGFSLTASARSVMQPGGWEMRAKITAQDPATGETKTISESTLRQCLAAAFLEKDPFLTPGIDKEKMVKRGASCSLADEQRNENSASWTMACKLADGALIDMSINNSASKNALRSDIRQVIDTGGRKVLMRILMDSKYIGKCTADMLQP